MKKTFQVKEKKGILQWIKANILLVFSPALILGANRLFYVLGRLISHTFFHSPGDFINISTSWEKGVELGDYGAWLVIPYELAFLFWIVMPFVVNCVLGKKAFHRLLAATLIGEVLCFFIWAFIPTKQDPMAYEQAYKWIYGDGAQGIWGVDKVDPQRGILGTLLGLVYSGDCPDNLMPSGHNTCTFIVFLIFCFRDENKKRHWGWLSFTLIFYVLVGMATIMLRQHCIFDVITGITIGVLAPMFIVDQLKLGDCVGNFYDSWHKKIKTSWVKIKENKTYIIQNICLVLPYFILLGGLLYFGLISVITGDPFKGCWYGSNLGDNNPWQPHNWWPQ